MRRSVGWLAFLVVRCAVADAQPQQCPRSSVELKVPF
jgi:hypothetical protein